MIAGYKRSGALTAGALEEFLAQTRPGNPSTARLSLPKSSSGRGYFALHSYIQPTIETIEALAELRKSRGRYRLATAVGHDFWRAHRSSSPGRPAGAVG
jgi:hypothetical protein